MSLIVVSRSSVQSKVGFVIRKQVQFSILFILLRQTTCWSCWSSLLLLELEMCRSRPLQPLRFRLPNPFSFHQQATNNQGLLMAHTVVNLCKLCDVRNHPPTNQFTSLPEEQAPMLAKLVLVLTQSLLAILELQKWLVRDPSYPHLFAKKVWHTLPMMKSVWYLCHIELVVFQTC